MHRNLALKNSFSDLDKSLLEKAKADLLKRGVTSIPFLMRKFSLSYETASEVFAEITGMNV